MQHQDKVTEVEPACLSEVSDNLMYGIHICENCLKEYMVRENEWGPSPRSHPAVAVTRFNKARVRELRVLREQISTLGT